MRIPSDFNRQDIKTSGKQEIYPLLSPRHRKETIMPIDTPSLINTTNDLENPLSPKHTPEEIMASLDALMESMKKNQSVLSKMADGWGNISLWVKISSGLVVFGSLLIIGILTLSTVLILSSCACSILFAMISIGLDDHHTTNRGEHVQFKSKIVSLGQFMTGIIHQLNTTRVELSAEITRLSELMTKNQVGFEHELSKLKLQADTSQQLNDVLGNMVKSFSICLDENHRSQTEFSQSLNHHLTEIIGGKEDFFQALASISHLEKELRASISRNEELYQKYEALVIQHEEKLKIESTKKTFISAHKETKAGLFFTKSTHPQEEHPTGTAFNTLASGYF